MERLDYQKILREKLTEGAFAMITKSEKDFADWIDRVIHHTKRCDELFRELKAYRDAEEQGLLFRLPKEFRDIDKRIIEYSLVKAINLARYGIEVDDRLESATQISSAISQAYMVGRQDERNKYRELRKEEAEQKLASMQKGE